MTLLDLAMIITGGFVLARIAEVARFGDIPQRDKNLVLAGIAGTTGFFLLDLLSRWLLPLFDPVLAERVTSFLISELSWVALPTSAVLIAIGGTASLRHFRSIASHSENHAWRLENILASIGEGILSVTSEGRIDEANLACVDMFGHPIESLKKMQLQDLLIPEDREALDYLLTELSGPQVDIETAEFSGIRADGTEFPILMTFNPAADDRKICVIDDVSDEKEQLVQLVQAQKMESIGRLTGGVAHDFNNLLTVILGNLELLKRSVKLEGEASLQLETAFEAGQKGANLTQRLLSYSRQQSLRPQVMEVGPCLREVEYIVRTALGDGIKLVLSIEDGLVLVKIDRHQLENAMINLAINARDAMPDGGTVAITVRNQYLANDDGRPYEVIPGNYVSISVEDNGIGMSKETQAMVFEPFFTTKPVGQGSGLGLSMVYGFMKQSGGYTEIESAPGEGTTITLLIPAMEERRSTRRASSLVTTLSSRR